MNAQRKEKAIEIITKSNNVNVSFNVPIKDSYSHVYEILIHNSNASLINELVQEGYSLSMSPKGLVVEHY